MATNNASNEPTGASGKIMQAQGLGVANSLSTATYPSTATGTGKILRADGTNWVPTTATFPDTAGTSGNVLTSDGTNWNSSAITAGGGILSVSGTLTNAQIKALHGTPIQVIAAPGLGKVIVPLNMAITMNYGGTNAFTAGGGGVIDLYYSTTAQLITGLTNANIIATASQLNMKNPGSVSPVTLSTYTNVEMRLYNPSATEIAGNAANDNTASYYITYFIFTP